MIGMGLPVFSPFFPLYFELQSTRRCGGGAIGFVVEGFAASSLSTLSLLGPCTYN